MVLHTMVNMHTFFYGQSQVNHFLSSFVSMKFELLRPFLHIELRISIIIVTNFPSQLHSPSQSGFA